MAYVAGGSYVHGHASGMEMELYGQGHVLGINNGSATYGTAIHENYYRLFAANNTVISNGASASSGGWIELGINTVTPEQYHDYVYHNVGDTLLIQSGGRPLPMTGDPERFQAPAKISWELQGNFQHPGWHYFDDVKTSKQTDGAYEAVFTAAELGDIPIHMRAMIPGGLVTEITQVNGPPSKGTRTAYQCLLNTPCEVAPETH